MGKVWMKSLQTMIAENEAIINSKTLTVESVKDRQAIWPLLIKVTLPGVFQKAI